MASRPSVAIRLGTTGKVEVKRDFAEIGDAGNTASQRIKAAFERDAAAAERAIERVNRTAQRLEAVSQSPLMGRINQATGVTGGSGGSAAASAAAFQQQFAQQEARARSLILAMDPLAASQARFNREMMEAKALLDAGALSMTRYQQKLMFEAGLLDQAAVMQQRYGQSVRGGGMMAVQASQQFQDFFIQVGSGQSVIAAGAMQLGQLAFVMQGATGAAGRFASFISGPWGAAVIGGTMLIGLLLPKLMQAREGLASATRELEDNARKAETTRQAQEAFAHSLPGITAAIRDETRALEEQNRSLEQNQQLALDRARQHQVDLERLRNINVGAQGRMGSHIQTLEAQIGAAGGDPRVTGMLRGELDAARAEQARLRRENATIQGQMAAAEAELLAAQQPIAQHRAEGRLDPMEGIHQRYQRMRDDAMQAARGNRVLTASLEDTLVSIGRLERVAEDAERARQDRARQAERDGQRESTFSAFTRPVAGGTITSRVGQRGGRPHEGVDIAVPVGTPVHASAAGTVALRSDPGGYGTYIVVDHGAGTTSLYAHLSHVYVGDGDGVEQGQLIGLSGGARGAAGAGNSRGAHLHFEVRRSGRAVNDPLHGRFPTNRDAVVRNAERSIEQTRDQLAQLRQELNPTAAAAQELADRIAQIQALMANPASGLSTEEGQRMLAEARRQMQQATMSPMLRAAIDVGTQANADAQQQRFERADQLARMRLDARDRLQLLERELSLGFTSERQRERIMRREAQRLELLRQFGPEHAAEIRAILDTASAEDELVARVEQLRDGMAEVHQVGANIIDEVLSVDNWDDWGEAGKRVLRMLLQEMITLALANPLKNAATGSNLPTLLSTFSSIFGGGGNIANLAADPSLLSQASALAPGAFASGTNNYPGGWAWMNENGRELVKLPSGSQIVPAADTRRQMAANDRGPALSIVNHNDFRGADASAVAAVEARQAMFEQQLQQQVLGIVADAKVRTHGRF